MSTFIKKNEEIRNSNLSMDYFPSHLRISTFKLLFTNDIE